MQIGRVSDAYKESLPSLVEGQYAMLREQLVGDGPNGI
jgi:hypothetical protein